MASAEQAVNASKQTLPVHLGARPIEQDALDIIEAVDARRYLPRQVYGMRTGWPTLDWHFLGFKHQGLMWVGGESGSSKTTFARHVIFATADAILREGLGTRLLVYVLEGGKGQFLRYYAGWKYGLSLRLFQPGGADIITEEQQDTMITAYSEFPSLPIDTCSDMRGADHILWDIERRANDGPIEGVILDNVQLLEYGGKNQWAENQRIALKALDLADKHEFPFMAFSQVNRTRDGIKPRGGPEWYNNATATFMVERGDSGDSQAQRQLSNRTTVANLKARYLLSCCHPLTLVGDRETGRLYEEAEAPARQQRDGGGQWPNNG
jgi:replicative DNA helicase